MRGRDHQTLLLAEGYGQLSELWPIVLARSNNAIEAGSVKHRLADGTGLAVAVQQVCTTESSACGPPVPSKPVPRTPVPSNEGSP